MQLGDHRKSLSEPNLVPLIDVLLVLIIIFMVITPTVPAGMGALIPQPPPKAVQPRANPDNSIVVQVSSNGQVKINEENTTWARLGERLTDIYKLRAEKVAFVEGQDNTPFADVARAIDIMRGSGIENVGLITARIRSGS